MKSIRLRGWPLVGWCSLLIAAICALTLVIEGADEAGIRGIIRTSAKTSLLLFMTAFVASALFRLWPSRLSRWILANRRYLGVSFAVSHFVHLAAILALNSASADFEVGWVTRIGGGLAYAFIAAMAATSFDRSAAWLGPRVWKRLHTTGMYYIWFIFLQSYLPRAIQSPAYTPAAALLMVAIGVRGLAWLRRGRGSSLPT